MQDISNLTYSNGLFYAVNFELFGKNVLVRGNTLKIRQFDKIISYIYTYDNYFTISVQDALYSFSYFSNKYIHYCDEKENFYTKLDINYEKRFNDIVLHNSVDKFYYMDDKFYVEVFKEFIIINGLIIHIGNPLLIQNGDLSTRYNLFYDYDLIFYKNKFQICRIKINDIVTFKYNKIKVYCSNTSRTNIYSTAIIKYEKKNNVEYEIVNVSVTRNSKLFFYTTLCEMLNNSYKIPCDYVNRFIHGVIHHDFLLYIKKYITTILRKIDNTIIKD
jgi:hypothetical protein